jgi:hypothetical protein
MSILERIHKWRYQRMDADGETPKFVPLRRDELLEIKSSCGPMVPASEATHNEVFGMGVFESPFAEEMRCRQVEMERVPFIAEVSVDETLATWRTFRDDVDCHLRRQLEAHICTDITAIEVTMEWDIWARWKRWLRLTRWFPVKTRTVKIDGRVLYPYLKVSLPQNRHHVRFALRP